LQYGFTIQLNQFLEFGKDNMNIKLIFVITILGLLLSFSVYRTNIINNQKKELENKVDILVKQQEDFKADLLKYNEEIANKTKEKNDFDKKLKELSSKKNSNDCLNQPIDVDVFKLFSEAGMSK
jgi:hypothetical protein